MGRRVDYANEVMLQRGPFTIVSCSWERQFAVFLRGRCIETFHNRQLALAYCKERNAA